MAEKKRERATNFCKEEENILVDLIAKNRVTLENKKSDSVTWKQKVWKDLTEEYNAMTGKMRTTEMLTNKYNQIKRAARKKGAEERKEFYKTGGGGGGGPDMGGGSQQLTDSEAKVRDLIKISCTGLENVCDSDGLTEKWTSWNKDLLSQEVNPALQQGVTDYVFMNVNDEVLNSAGASPEIVVETDNIPPGSRINIVTDETPTRRRINTTKSRVQTSVLASFTQKKTELIDLQIRHLKNKEEKWHIQRAILMEEEKQAKLKTEIMEHELSKLKKYNE